MKTLFESVKKMLEKSEDEFLFPGQRGNIGKAKVALKDRKLFRYLNSQMGG